MSESYLVNESLMPNVAYVILTLKCNLKCPHCYLLAGPDRKTSMPMNLRKRVIREIAKNKIEKICFSGGEPTTEMEKFIDTLRYTIETYKKLGEGIKLSIMLQTNAFFLTKLSNAETKEKLKTLKSAGVVSLDIASLDSYHGIPFSELHRIEKIAIGVFGVRYVFLRGAIGGIVVPIGRARWTFEENQWPVYTKECAKYEYDLIAIGADGGVYPCCWQATPAMGDLSKEPLIEIINRARGKGSISRKLAEKGGFGHLDPEQDLAISKEEFQRLLDKFGQCGACAEYWRWRVP